jgi:hypothetical protein
VRKFAQSGHPVLDQALHRYPTFTNLSQILFPDNKMLEVQLSSKSGLPDGFFSNPKFQFG